MKIPSPQIPILVTWFDLMQIVTIMAAAAAVPASSYSMSQTAKIRGVRGIMTNIIEVFVDTSTHNR